MTAKQVLFSLVAAVLPMVASAQNDVLATARQTNDYFMQKYSDPTEVTFVVPSSALQRYFSLHECKIKKYI